MIKVGVVGVSGYSGGVLLSILLRHPRVRVVHVSAFTTTGPVDEIWPVLRGRTRLVCRPYRWKDAARCDLVFLALPHTVSMTVAPRLLASGVRVVDLSGDYRLENRAAYRRWYGVTHKDPRRLGRTIYGLPEWHRGRILKADLVANPGCYATAAILALAPLAALRAEGLRDVIIDAKSGVTGAGKKPLPGLMAAEVNENLRAYKVLRHQHTPEIEDQISRLAGGRRKIVFVPHLVPLNCGILETIYISLAASEDMRGILPLYRKCYKTEPFVRVLPDGEIPSLRSVQGTNYCDIGLVADRPARRLIVVSALDNLYKGAAGQAVQNMNIMCGFPEDEGLR